MKKLDSLIFIENLPTLDLHGLDRDSARVAVLDFINDNLKMNNNYIVIVHGVGSGILREEVTRTLSKNKNVLEYRVWNYNRGCTVAYIEQSLRWLF